MDFLQQNRIIKLFDNFSRLVVPANDTGIFNYIFDPTPPVNPGDQFFLRVTNFSDSSYPRKFLHSMLLDAIQQVDVYNVTRSSEDPEPEQLAARRVLYLIVTCALIFAMSFLICLTGCFVSCCFWKSNNNNLKSSEYTAEHKQEPDASWCLDQARDVLHGYDMVTELHPVNYENNPTLHIREQGLPMTSSWQNHTPNPSMKRNTSVSMHNQFNMNTHKFSKNRDIRRHSKRSHCVLYWCNATLLLILFCTITLSFYATHGIQQRLIGTSVRQNSQRNCLVSGVDYVFRTLKEFFTIMIEQGASTTNESLKIAESKLLNELNETATSVVDTLLSAYKFDVMFANANSLEPRLKQISETLTIIRNEGPGTMQNISNYQGEFNVYASLLVTSLQESCNVSLEVEVKTECLQMLEFTKTVKFQFEPSKVNLNAVIGISVLMEKLNVNLTNSFQSFNDAEGLINDQISKLIKSFQKQFQFEIFIGNIADLWPRLNKTIQNSILNNLDTTGKTAQIYSNLVAYILVFAAYGILIFLLIILMIDLICLSLYIQEALGCGWFKKPGTLILDENLSNRVAAVTSFFPVYPEKLVCQFYNTKRAPVRSMAVCASFVSAVFILAFVLSFILLIAMNLLNSEVCRNFRDGQSIRRIDKVIELYLWHVWPKMFSENQSAIPQDVLQLLQVNPPTKFMSVITESCDPSLGDTNDGLLGKLGYERIFNFSTLLHGENIAKILTDTENELVKQIKSINFGAYIPNNLETIANQAQNITSFLDKISYNSTIEALTGPFLPTANLTAYCQQLRQLLARMPDTVETRQFGSVINLIQQSIVKYEAVLDSANQLITRLRYLDSNRNLTASITSLLDSVSAARVVVTNTTSLESPIRPAFRDQSKRLLERFDIILQTETASLVRKIVPCAALNSIFKTSILTICENEGLANAIGMNALLIAVICIFVCVHVLLFVKYSAFYSELNTIFQQKSVTLLTCVAICYQQWENMRPEYKYGWKI